MKILIEIIFMLKTDYLRLKYKLMEEYETYRTNERIRYDLHNKKTFYK